MLAQPRRKTTGIVSKSFVRSDRHRLRSVSLPVLPSKPSDIHPEPATLTRPTIDLPKLGLPQSCPTSQSRLVGRQLEQSMLGERPRRRQPGRLGRRSSTWLGRPGQSMPEEPRCRMLEERRLGRRRRW